MQLLNHTLKPKTYTHTHHTKSTKVMTCLMRTADWMAQNDTANGVLFQCCECRTVYGACWLNFAHTKIIQCKWWFPLIYRIRTACQIFRHTFLLITNQPILFIIIIFCFNLFAKSQSAKFYIPCSIASLMTTWSMTRFEQMSCCIRYKYLHFDFIKCFQQVNVDFLMNNLICDS